MEFKKEQFDKFINIFLDINSKINLISKNDANFLWEKHICDSLALEIFINKYTTPKNILDIGTGGGFPALPVSIIHPEINITALDSIGKKIRAVEYIKQELELNNLTAVCSRVENFEGKFDLVTSRAVSSLKNICDYALPKTKTNGYFVTFKSRKINEEINEAKDVLKKYNSKIIDIIDYKLPLEEDLTRKLVVIKKEGK